ncbi:ESX secretion-associated protein EspG [Lentzea rhizosphaerae]|uniref:ESX secretion-associated protein EspG n=1 Tax=Lentzea rhizosphaerae TaxID=2041025 RepID=A0ABV8BPH4_9PSEU
MTPAPHRLVLSAGEFAYLVEKTGVDLPPDWMPADDVAIGPAEAGLTKKRVVTGVGDEAEVHPSVERNLQILAGPTVLLDTIASIGSKSLHSVHAVNGPLGASLFALGDGAVELSMFASVDLGKELIRAVPQADPAGTSLESRLGGAEDAQPLQGRLPLEALQEMGAARLFRAADPDAPAAVLAQLKLSGDEASLAQNVAEQTDGALRCLVIWANGTSQVNWVHTAGGWSGLDPEPDGSGRRMVRVEPAQREDLGTWVAPAVAGALA